jgi:glycosyltransferase involved in cell wall biosynthesis
MNVNVALEGVFLTNGTGIYTANAFPSAFWQRYLTRFDRVVVIARVSRVATLPPNAVRLDNKNIQFHALPYWRGPWGFARKRMAFGRSIRKASKLPGAFILRMPGVIGGTLARLLADSERPFSVELVGNPHEVFQAGGPGSTALRWLYRWFIARSTTFAAAHAAAISYVSTAHLQSAFPHRPDAFTTNYSSIELAPAAVLSEAPNDTLDPVAPKLITVATLTQAIKGIDVLLRALALARREGVHARLDIVGDGALRTQLEALTVHLGIEAQVRFRGMLPPPDVFTALDQSDLFVLPSRSEGLPRAMIEAMARGLPCIGTSVGGIIELLPPELMVPPNDAEALCRLIIQVAHSKELRFEARARNLQKAREYVGPVLQARRQALYEATYNAASATNVCS